MNQHLSVNDVRHLIRGLLKGDRRCLARLISLVEDVSPYIRTVFRDIAASTGEAYCIGITGPPGSGKSTLINGLTALCRIRGLSVGIISVDPNSPFSGGALLGDRIRMEAHFLDSEVFMRSMGDRGCVGGLPQVISPVMRLMDASGKKVILLETVGVGQSDLRIQDVVDTTVVVVTPESGDVVQTMKAGLMEIGDIFVVNKADRPGALQHAAELKASLDITISRDGWSPRVMTAIAEEGNGIEELDKILTERREFLQSTSELDKKRGERRKKEFIRTIQAEMNKKLSNAIFQKGVLAETLQSVESGDTDPLFGALALCASNTLLSLIDVK